MNFGEQLRTLRTKQGLGVNQLALKSGVSASQISRLENGKKGLPKLETLKKLAQGLHVNENEFIEMVSFQNGNKHPSNVFPYNHEKVISIPVVGTIKCGPDGLAMYDNNGFESVSKDDLESGEDYFWLITSGDSMIGDHIQAGDYALIQKTQAFENGDICAVIVDGEEGTLKHVNKEDNMITLSASNPNYPPRVFVGEKMNEVYIAGKLIETKHKFN